MPENKSPKDEHPDEQTERVEEGKGVEGASDVPALWQEDLPELARQIAKEAGLIPDPKAEAEEERKAAEEKRKEDLMESVQRSKQARLDFFKHLSTLSGATIVGALAVFGAFVKDADVPSGYLYPSLASVALAMAVSGYLLGAYTGLFGDDRAMLRGKFWRDQEKDELIETAKAQSRTLGILVAVVTILWILGFTGLVGTIANGLLAL